MVLSVNLILSSVSPGFLLFGLWFLWWPTVWLSTTEGCQRIHSYRGFISQSHLLCFLLFGFIIALVAHCMAFPVQRGATDHSFIPVVVVIFRIVSFVICLL